MGSWTRQLLLPVFLCLMTVAAGGQDAPPQEAQEPQETPETIVLDEIVAKVNSEIITLTDLNRALRQLRLELEQEFTEPQELQKEFELRKKQVLRFMIQNKVMVQRAEEMGLTADIDLDVSTYLEEMRKESGIPSLEVLDQYFRQRGSSLSEFRERIKEQMIARSLLQQFVYSKITLLTPEVEAYYQEHESDYTIPGQVHLGEILLLTEDKDPAEVRSRAERVLERLEGGESFEDLARELSEGPTAARGGDIGTFSKGSMNEALEAVVFDLPIDGHSGLVESSYGFQIVKVLGREEPKLKPLQEVRPQIAERLYERKARPQVEDFVKQLFAESYIFVSPKYSDQYEVEGMGI